MPKFQVRLLARRCDWEATCRCERNNQSHPHSAQVRPIDKIVIQLNSNIVKVNEKVKALVEELAAQGKTTNHLPNDLFEGHNVASDKSFVHHVKKKKEEHNDSITPMEPQASNHCVTSIEAEEWERSSHKEE